MLAFWVLLFINDRPAEYRDVSDEPDHADWVGQRCTVLKGLAAHGVTLHPGPNEITDFVHIVRQNVGGGPEITFQVPIHRGMDMLITDVEQCTNCVMFSIGRIRYAVTIIPNLRELAPYRVFADSYTLAPDQVQCVQDASDSLMPKLMP